MFYNILKFKLIGIQGSLWSAIWSQSHSMYAPTSTAIFINIVHDVLVQFEMLNNFKNSDYNLKSYKLIYNITLKWKQFFELEISHCRFYPIVVSEH